MRRAREVVRRQAREVARATHRSQGLAKCAGALLEPGLPAPPVERARRPRRSSACARRRGRRSSTTNVLRQVERLELAAVAGSELRAVGEKERHVRTEAGGELVQTLGLERLGELLVREPERCRGVGAAAAETGGDRDLLLDPHPPAGRPAAAR